MVLGIKRSVGGLRCALTIAALASWLLALAATPAQAVPAFAVQTGQACQACHVGGFGPQLTPYGRQFKLTGYTARMVDYNAPVSAMAIASFLNTQKSQAGPAAPDFGSNNNVALDQVSVFLAGGLGSHLGAFVQTTYDGVARAFHWDNLDVRAVQAFDVQANHVIVGASVNNSPTLEDAWNTLPAWGFPYTGSSLAPSASASPLISGPLAQTTLGVSAYAWVNSQYYAAFGAYGSPGATTLTRLGVDPTSPGSLEGLAPYGRVGYQKVLGDHTLQIGAFGMQSSVYPGLDRSAGATDRYTDLGVDGSEYWARQNGDVVTLNARYIHERQDLRASSVLGLAENGKNTLSDLRIDASYYWRNVVGGTVQLFDQTGTADAGLYSGNRTAKPGISGVAFQLDGTPFGDGKGPLGPRFSLRLGLQYTLYSKFDGATANYDSAGGKPSDNNTLRMFAWIAY